MMNARFIEKKNEQQANIIATTIDFLLKENLYPLEEDYQNAKLTLRKQMFYIKKEWQTRGLKDTLLLSLIQNGQVDGVEILLDEKLKDNDEIFKNSDKLLENNATINAQDEFGLTSLDYANQQRDYNETETDLYNRWSSVINQLNNNKKRPNENLDIHDVFLKAIRNLDISLIKDFLANSDFVNQIRDINMIRKSALDVVAEVIKICDQEQQKNTCFAIIELLLRNNINDIHAHSELIQNSKYIFSIVEYLRKVKSHYQKFIANFHLDVHELLLEAIKNLYQCLNISKFSSSARALLVLRFVIG